MSAAPPNEERLMEIIRRGEGPDVEFKACRQGLSRAVYESVCAFLNRHGGTILLGVADDGEVSGIAPDVAAQMKKDFVTAINNPQKITPPTYLAVDEVEVAGKTLLRVFVPESSQVCNRLATGGAMRAHRDVGKT
jgi:ATP-dependent DNA helicase RecG